MLPIICPGHTRPVVDLQFSHPVGADNNYYLISACKDGKPMLRLGSTGDWIGTYEGHKGAVFCVAIDRNAHFSATGSADFSAKIWNARQGDLLNTLVHDHVVRALALGKFAASSDNGPPTHLISGTNNKNILLWDLEKADASVLKMSGHEGLIRNVCWLPDGNRCLSTAEDKQIRIWDLRSGKVTEVLEVDECINDVEISNSLALCTSSQKMRQIDLSNSHITESWTTSTTISLPCNALSASKYPGQGADDDVFVCGGTDNTVYKCRFSNGEVLEKYAKVHFGAINHIRFSPDGHLYATASDDGTLRLFQTHVGETYGLWQRVQPVSDLDCKEELVQESIENMNLSAKLPTTETSCC